MDIYGSLLYGFMVIPKDVLIQTCNVKYTSKLCVMKQDCITCCQVSPRRVYIKMSVGYDLTY